jgi:hypothetical protein
MEVDQLGTNVMLAKRSGFRTDWTGRSANVSKPQIEDHAATVGDWRDEIRADSGKQAGDPVRATQAIVTAVEPSNPPRHLVSGFP